MIDASSGAPQGRPDRLGWYRLFPADLFLDPEYQALPIAHRGAFGDLLGLQWLWGSLPDDIPELLRGINVPRRDRPAASRAIRAVLEEHFPLELDGRRRNPGLERARLEALEVRRRNKARAAEAAAKRWAGRKGPKQGGNPPLAGGRQGGIPVLEGVGDLLPRL